MDRVDSPDVNHVIGGKRNQTSFGCRRHGIRERPIHEKPESARGELIIASYDGRKGRREEKISRLAWEEDHIADMIVTYETDKKVVINQGGR